MILIKKPSLAVDLNRVEENIKHIVEKVTSTGLIFRPHFKTHQSHFIANIYRKYGVNKCTVSSVGMANYFAEDGWNDITIAFPTNILETDEINTLANRIQLQVLVDSVNKVKLLDDKISANISIFIEIDTGYFRSGVFFDKITEIEEIILAIEDVPQFSFAGFLSHTGNTYSQSSISEIIKLFDDSRKKIISLKNHFKTNYQNMIISMGDTPAASLASNFEGIDELRPGNFVFYDLTQYLLGSCKLNNIAVAVYCPIVAIYPDRNQIVIYGGGVHLSKEKTRWQNKDIYGFVSIPNQQGFGRFLNGAFVESLSQEHGIIRMTSHEINRLQLGDLLAILPVHSCITVDLNNEMLSLSGEKISKYRTY